MKMNELGKGSLFATGLVAGGALAVVVVALLSVNEGIKKAIKTFSAEPSLVEALVKADTTCSALLLCRPGLRLILFRS